jgi:thiol-disulfide isomerase/thioredoxin
MFMAKLSQNRQSQSGRLWVRIGLIGAALILVAAIASVVYRSNTGAPAPAANAPGSPTPTAIPATTAPAAPDNAAASLMVPAKVLETSFPTLDGQQRRLADYAGKVIVVNVWATWCGPCRVEIPHLVALAREFKGRGVEVIGLTTEDPARDAEKVREFIKEFKIDYPVGFANGEFALHLMQGRDVIPQAYVIGRGGRVHKHFIGFNAQTSPPQLRAAVEEAVAAGE